MLLLLLGVCGLLGMRRLLHANHAAWRAAIVASMVRLVIGVILMLILPQAGYQDNPASQAGYLFKDAYRRDVQAWELAQSSAPIITAFAGEFSGDQYGGMLALSALIYRYLSADAHRPFLVLIVTAAVSALGVLATWGVVKAWFGEPAALISAWLMALYPEAVLLGASHMREALVIPAIAFAWYGMVAVTERSARGGWLVAIAAIVLLLVQPAAALGVFLVLLVLWTLDPSRRLSLKRAFIAGGLSLLALVVLYSIWAHLPSLQYTKGWQVFVQWLENNFMFQGKITVRASGWLQNIIGDLGEQWRGVVLLVYGIFQPVLPAALITPGASIWRVVGIFRAAGWYFILPFLVYIPWMAWVEKSERHRRQLIWLAMVMWGWTLIASANGGGDQWDNPRYRTMFLVFMAGAIGWMWQTLRLRDNWREKHRWFHRLVALEGVFILVFSYWYVGRKYIRAIWLDIWVVLIIFLVLGGGIILWGWRQDHKRRQAAATEETPSEDRKAV